MSRRRHNEHYINHFLDVQYPNAMPGSPPREQIYDSNKPGSRVILKGPAWERVDSALGGMDEKGEVVNPEIARSYRWLCGLIDEAAGRSWAHRLATRYVLINPNTAGGHKELERLEDMNDEAATTVAKLCREVLESVLDRLDERGYFLGWGFDVDIKRKREAAADRRKASVLATEDDALEAIRGYYELMLQTDRTAAAAEVATSEQFQCGISKVRKATRGLRAEAS